MPHFPTSAWLASLPVSLLALLALLVITYLIGVRQRRHVVIDAAWGIGFVVVSTAAFLQSGSDGDTGRRILLLVLTAVWGLRLGGYLAWRMRDGHEDPRYDDLLAPGGARGSRQRNLFAIRRVYLPQAIVLFLVSMVQQVGMFETGPLGWIAWIGVAVWAVGIVFEALGDRQLAQFRADPSRRGTILDTGVWAWTRHPNYFGDSAAWWGLFLVTADSWPGVLTVISPLLMTWALVARTGKALTEQRMSGRPGHADYVARTSGFVPLPPKRR